MLSIVDSTRRAQLAWLKAIQEQTGWNQSEVAKRGGFSHATLSRFRNDPDNLAVLDTRTITKIAAISPIPHYENKKGDMPEGFDEDEATPYMDDGDEVVERAINAIRNGHNSLEPWVLRTNALENLGYRSGDILIVDFAAVPKVGDVVYATIFGKPGSLPGPAFRLYHKPYLVASSNSARHQAPRLIDDRVEVRGVVTASVRARLTSLAS